MQIPLQITFRNMDPSPAMEAIVREKAAKLDRFFERIVSCDVTIEARIADSTRAHSTKSASTSACPARTCT